MSEILNIPAIDMNQPTGEFLNNLVTACKQHPEHLASFTLYGLGTKGEGSIMLRIAAELVYDIQADAD